MVGYAARSGPGPRRLALLELLAPLLAMLRYSRFPWLSIVDYCRQDSCNVLYYREIDPAAGTSGLLAGIGRVWPRESVWSEKGGSFHFEDGGERGEWPPGWIGCPQALANARQGRGFALIEVWSADLRFGRRLQR